MATPPTGPKTLSQVIFSEDDSKLIVAAKGDIGPPVAPGFLAVWSVNADGTLSDEFTRVALTTGGVRPFGTVVVPGSNALLVADPAVGAELVDLSGISGATSNSGPRSSILNITGQGANCWSAYSPKTGSFYLEDPPNARISEVRVDKNLKGTVIKVCLDVNTLSFIAVIVTVLWHIALPTPGHGGHFRRGRCYFERQRVS